MEKLKDLICANKKMAMVVGVASAGVALGIGAYLYLRKEKEEKVLEEEYKDPKVRGLMNKEVVRDDS